LTPGDVQEHPEFGWYIEITDKNDGQHLKTESSRRRVPVHAELIKAGFLQYRAAMLAGGSVRLFPELKPDKHGIVTASWSKWWGRYARDTVGIADRSKVFHSFRHLFKDTCRDAGILEEVHDALTGHKRGGMAGIMGAVSTRLVHFSRPCGSSIIRVSHCRWSWTGRRKPPCLAERRRAGLTSRPRCALG